MNESFMWRELIEIHADARARFQLKFLSLWLLMFGHWMDLNHEKKRTQIHFSLELITVICCPQQEKKSKKTKK